MSEQQLQDQILECARAMGLLAYHTHDSRHSQAGFPDLVIIGALGMVYLELKSATGKVTSEQDQWLWALKGVGQRAFVVRPKHWPDEVLPILKSLGGAPKVPAPEMSQAALRKRVSGARKGPPASTV